MLAGKQNFFIVILILSCLFFNFNAKAQFAPAPPDINSTAIFKDDAQISFWANEISLNKSWQNIADTTLGKVTVGDENSALGKANNLFVSLGDGGSAILKFPYTIYNENGFDFAVFENGFAQVNDLENYLFMELAFVEVSQNGVDFIRFSAISNLDTSISLGGFGTSDCSKVNNLAGKYGLNYGTPFDMEELGLDSIVSIKIIDVVGSLDSTFCTFDSQGHKINDPFPTPFPSSGFDLNAVAALNQKNKIEYPTAILEKKQNILNIFPNPSEVNSEVTLELAGGNEVNYKILDLNGKQVLNSSFRNRTRFSTQNFAKGIYFIVVFEENSIFSYKFMID